MTLLKLVTPQPTVGKIGSLFKEAPTISRYGRWRDRTADLLLV